MKTAIMNTPFELQHLEHVAEFSLLPVYRLPIM